MNTIINAINWFEIPVTDFNRAKKFYQTLFKYDMMETMRGNIRMGFFPYEMAVNRVGGAICFGDGYIPSETGTMAYLNGDPDLQLVLYRIEPAGGTVLLSKTALGEDIGYYAIFRDTEGNRVALHSRA